MEIQGKLILSTTVERLASKSTAQFLSNHIKFDNMKYSPQNLSFCNFI